MLFQLITILLFASTIQAKTFRLSPGQSYDEKSVPLKLIFESFHTTKTECAVPGFNCGSGYTPDPVTTPIIKRVWKDKTCEQSPRPKYCELDFQIIQTDKRTYIELKIINPFDRCMKDENQSNRNSCILNTTKGSYDEPALNPDNCNRINELEVRDGCYEALADKLQDPRICEKMKGPQGFQCIYLRAKAAKDRSICHQLQVGPRVRSEEERKSAIDSCLNSIK